jgi:hypothetical protein
VKLKVAALSAVLTWSILALFIPVWLLTCCEVGSASAVIVMLPPALWVGAFGGPLSLFLGFSMLVTWRLLATNIYLGALGNRLLFNAAFCGVFLMMFALIPIIGWIESHKDQPPNFQPSLEWLQWVLALLMALKLGLALRFVIKGKQRGLLSNNGVLAYLCAWIWGTELLLLCVLFAPVTDVSARVLGLLALLSLPLARIAIAPLAYARSRVH